MPRFCDFEKIFFVYRPNTCSAIFDLWVQVLVHNTMYRGGPLKCQGGYQAHPKIHLIRVVFQDQAMYVRTSFRGAKTCKIGKKGCVFGHIDKFWKGHDRQIKKNARKNTYLGSIFIPEKYVIRVLFVSPWTSLIPPLAIRVAPRECTRDTWWYYLEIPLISSSRTGDSC